MRLVRSQRHKDPVKYVCNTLIKETYLLCFDEFQIIDITDAMIVGRIFEELFSGGMTIITTSNSAPDDLYPNGLNRNLFLPFLELIKKNLDVIKVDNDVDYRRKKLVEKDRYFHSNSVNAKKQFDNLWNSISSGAGEKFVIRYQGRQVELRNFNAGACRILFHEICERSLGPSDYLNICYHVKILFLENIPALDRSQNDIARRFMLLIDTLYEAKIRLVCYGLVHPDEIYPRGRFKKDFERTVSRLNEMRSETWPNLE